MGHQPEKETSSDRSPILKTIGLAAFCSFQVHRWPLFFFQSEIIKRNQRRFCCIQMLDSSCRCVYISGTQMTLVLVGKGLVWGALTFKARGACSSWFRSPFAGSTRRPCFGGSHSVPCKKANLWKGPMKDSPGNYIRFREGKRLSTTLPTPKNLWLPTLWTFAGNDKKIHEFRTVDGWNPAFTSWDWYFTLLLTGLCTLQVVQDSFHQQYLYWEFQNKIRGIGVIYSMQI